MNVPELFDELEFFYEENHEVYVLVGNKIYPIKQILDNSRGVYLEI